MNLLTTYIDLENSLLANRSMPIVIITGTLRPDLLKKVLQQNSHAQIYFTSNNKKYLNLYNNYPQRIKFRLLDNKFPFYEYFIIQLGKNKAILGKTIEEMNMKTLIKNMIKQLKEALQSEEIDSETSERKIIFTQVSLNEQSNLQNNINLFIEKINSTNYFHELEFIKENNNLQISKKIALNLIRKYPEQDYFFRLTSALISENKQENHEYIIEKLHSPSTPAPIENIYNQVFTEYFHKIFIKFQVAIEVSTDILRKKINAQNIPEVINLTIQYLKLLIEYTTLLLTQTDDPEEQKLLKAQIEQYKKDLEDLENPNCPIKDKHSEKYLLPQEAKTVQKQVHAITKIIHPDIAPPQIKDQAKELTTLVNEAYANKDKHIVNFIYKNIKSIKNYIKQYPQQAKKYLIQITLISKMLLENNIKGLEYLKMLDQYNKITDKETKEQINNMKEEIINLKQKISELKNLGNT